MTLQKPSEVYQIKKENNDKVYMLVGMLFASFESHTLSSYSNTWSCFSRTTHQTHTQDTDMVIFAWRVCVLP